MNGFVTCGTGGNEVVLGVRTAMTAVDDVVHLKVRSAAAELAAPVVAFENFESQDGFSALLRASSA